MLVMTPIQLNPDANRYVASRVATGVVELLVKQGDGPGKMSQLRDWFHYTSEGFEWGYPGGGPQRLAYTILIDLVAHRFGRKFMEEVVSRTSPIEERQQMVVFREEDILDWLAKKISARRRSLRRSTHFLNT